MHIPRFHIYRSTMFAFSLMVVANTFSFVWLFQGLSKIRIVSIVNIFSKLLILPLIFFFIKTSNDYLLAAYIQSLVYVCSSLLVILILIRNKYITFWSMPNINKILSEIKSAFLFSCQVQHRVFMCFCS
jgi:O-antigen/teichoic acid export membrane protein